MRTLVQVAIWLVTSGAMLAQVTVVRAGRLVDTDSGTILSNQTIVISGNKIRAVGPNLKVPDGAKVIDLSDKTVLPGLIDCHTHVADGQADAEPFNALKKTASQVVLESIPNARNMLLSGFTTVRDVGTYRALNDVALRDAINRGDVIGPRMFVAGAYVTITGGAGAMTGQAPDIAAVGLALWGGKQSMGGATEGSAAGARRGGPDQDAVDGRSADARKQPGFD